MIFKTYWLEDVDLQMLANIAHEIGDEIFIGFSPYDVGKCEKLLGKIINTVLFDSYLDMYRLLKTLIL